MEAFCEGGPRNSDGGGSLSLVLLDVGGCWDMIKSLYTDLTFLVVQSQINRRRRSRNPEVSNEAAKHFRLASLSARTKTF